MRKISASLAITLDGVTDSPQEWMRHNEQTAKQNLVPVLVEVYK